MNEKAEKDLSVRTKAFALQELEETSYWLQLLSESGVMPSKQVTAVRAEAAELTAIL